MNKREISKLCRLLKHDIMTMTMYVDLIFMRDEECDIEYVRQFLSRIKGAARELEKEVK